MARPAALAVALGVAALAAVWAVAAWWLWQTDVPSGLDLPDVAAEDVLAQPALGEARDFERFVRWSYVASALVLVAAFARLRALRRALDAGVRGGPDRHRDAAGDARPRARVARPGALRAARPLVAAPPRRLGARLRRLVLPELVRARRRVPVRVPRAPDRDGPGRAAGELVVDPGGGGLRRARRPVHVRLALPDPGAGRRRPGARRGGGPARGGAGARADPDPHPGGRRVGEPERRRHRPRPDAADHPLEHARRQLRPGRDRGRARATSSAITPGTTCRRASRGTRSSRCPGRS